MKTQTYEEKKGYGAPIRHYLDVSAVRIQTWLARTPDLKLRRGASIMLSDATGRDAWPDELLPPGTRWNEEAGDLDGVVSLVADGDFTEAMAREVLAGAAREVAARLRHELPNCPIQAVTGTGDSYAAAFQRMEEARREYEFVVDSPPAPAELILAKPCDQCRDAPAQHENVEIVGNDKREGLCPDCKLRVEAAGGTKGDRESRSPRPEKRMKAAVNKRAGMNVTGFPDDFTKMAELGRRHADDESTHLALIYADGNRVGGFLSEAAEHARRYGKPEKSQIVPALDGATLDALADAVAACFAGFGRPPVLADLAGGDDLLVSVPAWDAWPFTRTLLAAFRRRLAAAAEWPEPVRKRLPTLSAGLVFHHRSAPFSDVVQLAKDQLDEAKRATAGTRSSLAFLDLTADGGQVPPSRHPLTLEELDQAADRMTRIAEIPQAHRQTLAALHRLCPGPSAVEAGASGRPRPPAAPASHQPAGRGETPVQALARRTADLGYRPLWEAVAGPRAGADEVRLRLESDPSARDDLRRALDLARWWPARAGSDRQEVPA